MTCWLLKIMIVKKLRKIHSYYYLYEQRICPFIPHKTYFQSDLQVTQGCAKMIMKYVSNFMTRGIIYFLKYESTRYIKHL